MKQVHHATHKPRIRRMARDVFSYLRSCFRSLVKLSRMRRSDTWDVSLLRKSDDPFQPEAVPPAPPGPSTPLPSVHSTSGVISFAASGGDDTGTGNGPRGLLADIFRPDGTGSSRGTSAGSGPVSPASDAASARRSLSTLTLDPASAVASDDVSLLPTSPRHRSTLRRQFTLPAFLEAESDESKMAEKKRTQLLDINNNNDEDAAPEKASSLQGDTTPPSSPYGGQAKASAADLALPEAMKVPEAISHPPPPPPLRKLGILDLFAAAAAGDRINVRNKDLNFMAPQSW